MYRSILGLTKGDARFFLHYGAYLLVVFGSTVVICSDVFHLLFALHE